ncbi:MAG: exonuclease sbcCD subunit D, partial [Bacteroidales bacterium]
QIQYTALGHLHRMHKVDDSVSPVYYSGSPISYSFSEANQKKFVLIADILPGEKAEIREIELSTVRPLLRKRVNGIDEAIEWLSENQNALVELTLVTDTFITPLDRRKLNSVHQGIVTIIPEVISEDLKVENRHKQIDLNRSMEELFSDYFTHEKGQAPSEDIMSIFREILAEEEEE